MQTPELDAEQIVFLDHLIAITIDDSCNIDEQDYGFYKYQVEQWLAQGYYHDAMLAFWYYEPIEGLHSQQLDNFYNFIKVVNGLGFLMPSIKQAAIINTLNHIDLLNNAQSIDEKIDSIYGLWTATEEESVHDLLFVQREFGKMRSDNLLREDKFAYFNEEKLNHAYQHLLDIMSSWQKRYPQSKTDLYQSLIYKGEDFSQQLALLQPEPESALSTAHRPDANKTFFHEKWQQLQRWLKST